MSEPTEHFGPWGIIVTRTLHLAHPGLDPACGDWRVQAIVDGLRRRYRAGDYDAPMIFGNADGRPVCLRCVRALHRYASRIDERLEEVAYYEAGRSDG
jgi:hypothetical protein